MLTGNYYEILGVDQSATSSDIRKAYVTKIREYPSETHPEEFQVIRTAYEILKDDTARAQYDKTLQCNGRFGKQLEDAMAAVERGNFSEAARILRSMNAEFPEESTIQYYLALSYYRLSRLQEAKQIASDLVLNDPNNEQNVYLLAHIFMELNEPQRAINQLKKLISLNPDENTYYMNLSNMYAELKRYDEARDILEQSLRLRTRHDVAEDFPFLTELYFIALLQENNKQVYEVISRIEQLAKDPEDKKRLLIMLIGVCVDMGFEPDSRPFIDFTNLIRKINAGEDPQVNEWLMDLPRPSHRNEARTERSSEPRYESRPEPSPSSNRSDPNTYEAIPKEDRSLGLAIVIGIILSFVATPLVGIIAGIIAYYNTAKIKQLFSFLGCLIIVGIIIAILVSL